MLRRFFACVLEDHVSLAPEPKKISHNPVPIRVNGECPICFTKGYLSSYTCGNGHTVCDPCLAHALRHPPSRRSLYVCCVCRDECLMDGKRDGLVVSVCDECGRGFGKEEREANEAWLTMLRERRRHGKGAREGRKEVLFACKGCRRGDKKWGRFGFHQFMHKPWKVDVPYAISE